MRWQRTMDNAVIQRENPKIAIRILDKQRSVLQAARFHKYNEYSWKIMIFIEKQPALCYNKKDNPDDSFLRK